MRTAAPPAPIPKRSKLRWYLVGGFAIVVLATPFVYLLVADHLRERELRQIYAEMDAEDPHWRWPDLIKQLPPAPPDERNAFMQLEKVAGMLKATPFANPLKQPPAPINARLTETQEQRLRAALGVLAPNVLEEAHKLKDMPQGCVPIDPTRSARDVVFDLKILKVMRALESEAMLRIQEARLEEAMETCLAIIQAAHAVGDVPHLLAQLVRTAAHQDVVRVVQRTVANGIVGDDSLKEIQTAMAIEASPMPLFDVLRGERAFGHEAYVALRAGDLTIAQMLHGSNPSTFKGELYSYFYAQMLLRDYAQSLRHYNELVRASKLKDEVQIEALRRIEETNLDSHGLWSGRGGFLFGQINEWRADHTRLRCAVAAIAAERYRLKHDQWPNGIAELVKAGLFKEPITDPYDGQPLRFRRTDTGLMVYSIGQDKIDNVGKKGDITFELWLPQYRAIAQPPEVKAPMKGR